MTTQMFSSVGAGRHNNFDFLRFLFASVVIYSHSFAMLQGNRWGGYDPLLHWTHGQLAFGGAAVDGFFLISGFLILKSWFGSESAVVFAAKRALRILPALVVVLLLTVMVIGPLATSLPLRSYFDNPHTYVYFGFLGTVSLHETDRLPGLFERNPLAFRVNGSLWTIRCEILCYVLTAVLGTLRCYQRPLFVLLVTIGATIILGSGGHLLGLGEFADSFRVLVFFFWGMSFYLYQGSIPHSRRLMLLSLAGLALSDAAGVLPLTLPLLGGYCLFYVAFSPKLRLQQFAKHGDFSYGLYLYAFPVQQVLVSHFRPVWTPETLTAASFLIAGLCAVVSWRYVEKPFLRRRPHTAQAPELPADTSLAGAHA